MLAEKLISDVIILKTHTSAKLAASFSQKETILNRLTSCLNV